MDRPCIDVEEKVPFLKALPLSLQHLFAMFGGTVLVPTLLGIDPATVLLFNGLATVFYLVACGGKIPAFLGSSFAFIGPVTAVIMGQMGVSYEHALGGFFVVGLITAALGLLMTKIGYGWIRFVFPPAAIGAIMAVIGLGLAPAAAMKAGLTPDSFSPEVLTVSVTTLCVTVFGYVFFRGFLSTVPILIGILTGYVLSVGLGMVDFSVVAEAPWFRLPTFYRPVWDINAVFVLLPIALVSVAEHIGDVTVIGSIVNRDLLVKPGLGRSLAATGISMTMTSLFGAPPQTAYSENVGVLAISRVFSVWIIGGAAVLSVLLSFFGKFSAVIVTIPDAVMGGVSLLLFGVIATSGVRMLIQSRVDYDNPENTVVTSLVFLIGVSGASVSLGGTTFAGMSLATIVAVFLSVVFTVARRLKRK